MDLSIASVMPAPSQIDVKSATDVSVLRQTTEIVEDTMDTLLESMDVAAMTGLGTQIDIRI